MTRRTWWAWLFGGTAAGQNLTEETGTMRTADLIPARMRDPDYLRWRSGPALNGQCPVCGTMAPPYVWKPDPGVIYIGSPRFKLDENNQLIQIPEEPYRGPSHNWLACAHCNAVFQQRAEERK